MEWSRSAKLSTPTNLKLSFSRDRWFSAQSLSLNLKARASRSGTERSVESIDFSGMAINHEDSDFDDLSDSGSEEEEGSTHRMADGPRGAATPVAKPLDFDVPKLLFIFERMASQPPSVELIVHASKLIFANASKLVRESRSKLDLIMAIFLRKDMLEEAMSDRETCDKFSRAILMISEAPDYVLPISIYHVLNEEVGSLATAL